MNPRATPIRRFALLAILGAASLAGCGDNRVTGTAQENEDANFLEGQKLEKEGKDDAALECFTKVILSRRSSPEAHLEAGNLCLDTSIKDPLQAIFHFRQYVKESPGMSFTRKDWVNGRIRAAEKDYLRKSSLPFGTGDGAGNDALLDQIKRLREENDTLKRRQSELYAAAAKPAAVLVRPVPDEDGNSGETLFAPAPAAVTSAAAPVPASAVVVAPPVATAAVGRKYAVVQGDNLSRIATKVYGSPKRWREIQTANQDKLGSGSSRLKIGMELTIPN